MTPPAAYSYLVDVPIFGAYEAADRLWRFGPHGWEYFSSVDWAWHPEPPEAAASALKRRSSGSGLPIGADAAARLIADRPRWVRYYGVADTASVAAGTRPVAVVRARDTPAGELTERFSDDGGWTECEPIRGAIADLPWIGPHRHLFGITAGSAAALLHATWGDAPFDDLSPWTADERWGSADFHLAHDEDLYFPEVSYPMLWRQIDHEWEYFSPISWDWRSATAELGVSVPADLEPISPASALVHAVDRESWFRYLAVYSETAPPPDGAPYTVLRIRCDPRNELDESFTVSHVWARSNLRFRSRDARDDDQPVLVPTDAETARTILVAARGPAAAASFPTEPVEIGWTG